MLESREAFADRNVLITGGLGFIGSNLAHRLVALDSRVTLVDNLQAEFGGNRFNIAGIEDSVRVEICDQRDERRMRDLVHGQHFVFNLAGQTSHMDSMLDPYQDLEMNCRAQLSLLEACRRSNPAVKLVFASTRQIYGKPAYQPVNEKHPVHPIDVNGANKLAGECYHLVYESAYGIAVSVLRLTNTIGPRMRIRDARQTFLGAWIGLLLEGKPFEVWGGEQLRDFTYVDDAVDAFLLAAASDAARARVFNLGGNGAVSLAALAELLIELNGAGEYTLRRFPPAHESIDIGDYRADYRLIESVLGWRPRLRLRDALAETLTFYRRHLRHYR